ncbi:MAG: thiosulfate oxidation carrier complex protein SoxZ [Alphaproteobacteria bacterium]|jgi:sulfur-oxidizing protein SoxZ|nr:thiosulfate oxidation carrier complex protein SoxZ [Alphaproteobacteria bacterium]
MTKIRLAVPETASAGEVIEIKTLIAHPMETGFRRDAVGKAIPRNIITDFLCLYNGEEIFRAAFHPAVAANPYLTFYTTATESGELVFVWTDQYGERFSASATIAVE